MIKTYYSRKEMEEAIEALNGYLESLTHIEILYSPKRGYLLFRWDNLIGAYYGIDSVDTPDQLAIYIYSELIDRITVETKSDHNIKELDFNEIELNEARAITNKFISVLPEEMKSRICKKLDQGTGLILNNGCVSKNLLG